MSSAADRTFGASYLLSHARIERHPIPAYIRLVPDESLLTDEIRALVGHRTELGPATITLRLVQRATEVFYGHPGRDYAQGEEVPGYVISALDPEIDPPEMPKLLPQGILISNEWAFERYPRLGETLVVTSSLANISERFGGQFGYSLDFRTETEYRATNGDLVATSSTNMMQYDASAARSSE